MQPPGFYMLEYVSCRMSSCAHAALDILTGMRSARVVLLHATCHPPASQCKQNYLSDRQRLEPTSLRCAGLQLFVPMVEWGLACHAGNLQTVTCSKTERPFPAHNHRHL